MMFKVVEIDHFIDSELLQVWPKSLVLLASKVTSRAMKPLSPNGLRVLSFL